MEKAKQTTELKTAKVIARILGLMKPKMYLLVFAAVLSIGGAVAALFVPQFIGNAIDAFGLGVAVDFYLVGSNVVMLLALVMIVFCCQWLSNILLNALSYNTIKSVRDKSFKKLTDVSIRFVDNNSHGDLLSRVTIDAEQISEGLILGLNQVFTGGLIVIGTIVFMFVTNWAIAIAVILLTPLSLGVVHILAKKAYKGQKARSEKLGELSGLAEEYITSQKVVKAFGIESRAEEKFDKINEEYRIHGQKALFYSAIVNPVTRFVNAFVYAVVVVMGAVFIISGNANVSLTIGGLSAMLAYAVQYSRPFNDITALMAEVQSAFNSARRVFKIIDEKNDVDGEGKNELQNVAGNIEFKDVEFSYCEERPFIKDLSFKIKAGQRVALVGETGCGKTTIANLLMRFYEINGGLISIDGVDITTITKRNLRANIGMVLQDSRLFSGTVLDNIAYGKENTTLDEVIAAAKSARCHCFIKRLKDGFYTQVGDNGCKLSEGQKQLICIARLMLVNPPIVILDEATSSVDVKTEKRIVTAFNEIMKGKTCIVIAHRLSTIKDSDIIFVMQNGEILEQGTHEQLLGINGVYSKLTTYN